MKTTDKKHADYYKRKYGEKAIERVSAIKSSYQTRGIKQAHLDSVLQILKSS